MRADRRGTCDAAGHAHVMTSSPIKPNIACPHLYSQSKMSFLRPYRLTRIIRTVPRPILYRPSLQARFASGYGDPSDDAHPATANPQEQGSSTQKKQPEHPGPRENEPSEQGGSSFGDKGQNTKVSGAPTDTKSAGRASQTSWDGPEDKGGSKVHGSGKETKLGGSLSGNKDKSTTTKSEAGNAGVKGDMSEMGEIDPDDAMDAKEVGGTDDSRKQR